MTWTKGFEKNFLTVGKRLYAANCVSSVSYSNNKLRAIVEDPGNNKAVVNVIDPSAKNPIMLCSCYIASKDYKCMHMAAVMYMWEEEKDFYELSPKSKDINIFEENESRGNTYFDLRRLIAYGEYDISRSDYEAAKKLIKQKKIAIDETDLHHEASSYFAEEVQVLNVHLICERSAISISLTQDDIQYGHCGCCNKTIFRSTPYYYNHDYFDATLCPHFIASFILLDRYLQIHDPGDDTDYNGERFLDFFAQERIRDNLNKTLNPNLGELVSLSPRIVEYDSGYMLEFRISKTEKRYVVKDIFELVRTKQECGDMKFGKNLEIDFLIDRFDEKSSPLFAVIENEVAQKEEDMDFYLSSGFYHSNNTGRKGIPLKREILDVLYEQFKDQSIDFDSFGEKIKSIHIRDDLPVIDINIKAMYDGHNREKVSRLIVTGEIPVILRGNKRNYFIKDGVLGKIDDEVYDKIASFVNQATSEDRTFSFMIGEKRSPEFYHRILPSLSEDPIFNITISDISENAIKTNAQVTFFLDSDKGQILCRAQAEYEDKSFIIKPDEYEMLPIDKCRDMHREDQVQQLLNLIFYDFDPESGSYILRDDDDERYDFLSRGLGFLLAEGEVKSTDAFSALKIRRNLPVQLGISVRSDLLDIDLMTEGIDEDELGEILNSYKLKKRYHKLRSGDFIDLEGNESLDIFSNTMGALGVKPADLSDGHLTLPGYRALYLDNMLEEHEDLVADRDRHFRSLIKNFKTINDSDFEIPTRINGELRGYQKFGFKWLKTLETAGFCGILADDMGLGKTFQLITLLTSYKEDNDRLKALVICPASLVYNWIEEFEKFAPEINAVALAGTKNERKQLLSEDSAAEVFITSYDLLKRDIELYEDITFTHEILDEAQFVKNAKALAAKSVKSVKAEHKFALTGTPIENRLSELWSIFDFLMPGFLYGYEEFKKRYELPISKHGDEAATESLKKQVSPFILRRKKGDVLKDLPDKTEEIIYAVMDDKQKKVYDAQLLRLKNAIDLPEEDFNKSKIKILAELTRIRQICCDPSLLFEDYDGASAKKETCMQLVSSVTDAGHKMLLFSQFTSMLELLEEELSAVGIAYKKITGETKKEDRLRLVKEFNTDDTPVFLISLKAGGTGLNLTGADIVIHYDPWWNIAAQDQATDRAHRIGQTKNVTVYKLIAKGSIEEKILKLQETKKELADSILSGDTKSLGSMSKEELMEILG